MRIVVVSDSHGDVESIRRCVAAEIEEGIDLLLHAGDSAVDATDAATGVEILAVKGNWDSPYERAPETRVVELGKTRLLFCHGHAWRVKTSYDALVDEALRLRASVCVFGHTHVALLANVRGVLLINPGSCSTYVTRTNRATYAVVDVVDGDVCAAQIKSL